MLCYVIMTKWLVKRIIGESQLDENHILYTRVQLRISPDITNIKSAPLWLKQPATNPEHNEIIDTRIRPNYIFHYLSGKLN